MIRGDFASHTGMSKVRSHISISVDGFVAGPNQTLEEPLGRAGEQLHEWALATAGWREHHGLEGGERGPDSDVIVEPVEVVASPAATHIRYRVGR